MKQRSFAVILSLFAASSVSAQTGDERPYVRIVCDDTAGMVTVAEGVAPGESEILKGRDVQSLDQMLRLKPVGNEDGILLTVCRLKRTCRLGKSIYKLEVEPYVYNRRVQGMCGAAAPTVKLKVSRNNRNILQGFVFKINCPADGDTETIVDSVSLHEANNQAVFATHRSGVAAQKSVEFSNLPNMQRRMLFE